jgi:hypothetical protein
MKIDDNDYEVLLPLVKNVLDAVHTAKDERDMEQLHRL